MFAVRHVCTHFPTLSDESNAAGELDVIIGFLSIFEAFEGSIESKLPARKKQRKLSRLLGVLPRCSHNFSFPLLSISKLQLLFESTRKPHFIFSHLPPPSISSSLAALRPRQAEINLSTLLPSFHLPQPPLFIPSLCASRSTTPNCLRYCRKKLLLHSFPSICTGHCRADCKSRYVVAIPSPSPSPSPSTTHDLPSTNYLQAPPSINFD